MSWIRINMRTSKARIIALNLAILAAAPVLATPQATTAPTTTPVVKNAAGEIVIDFANAPVGKPSTSWTEGGWLAAVARFGCRRRQK